ncbi:transmembrane protein permease [Spiroplasma eriocheiris]|uniref:Transmembrane protein permease n=1 Tax=Spiroplasma eriocheiris TaxID=315358 RepID=A0A0H3XMN1_9MOLU|nr:APC family permease [Spiroplasma eriocheiris]AKM54247.1 transmembrane protein permease [Spiroplasma eriocheiris]
MVKQKKETKKFSLADFVWLGFNYTVGIGFIGNFAILSNINQPDSIGIHVIWLFAVEGLIAGICAWAFAKMARVHHSDNNGASYIYVRTSFGKFWGIFIAFMQYISLPFLITIQVMMLIRGTFGADWISTVNPDGSVTVPWYAADWGAFGDLWLDLIGIVIYMSAALVIFGGMKLYKKLASGTGVIKWITAGFLILAGLVLACQNGGDNLSYWSQNSKFSLGGFVKAFNSCFFFFAGFEVFSTAGRNISKPEKNISRGIILIMLISTIFYIVISIIFFAAFNEFVQNMNMGSWNKFSNKVILYGGPIIMILSAFALKMNVAMQNALYGGTSLQPLSKEGFLPDRLRKLNKDGLPVRASLLNLTITALMIFIWLAIPDIVKGASLTHQFGFMCTVEQAMTYKQPFDISSLTEASSAITIFIYGMVVAVTLKLAATKKVKMQVWEWVAFPIIIVILAFAFAWHYYSLISGVVTAKGDEFESHLIGTVIELAFVGSSAGFGTLWYFTYYRHKYLKRMQTRPELQAKLDAEFEVVDDWKYTSKEIRNELRSYLVRNKALHAGTDNPNRQDALHMLEELNIIFERYSELEAAEDSEVHED